MEERPLAVAIKKWNLAHFSHNRCQLYRDIRTPARSKVPKQINCTQVVPDSRSRVDGVFVAAAINHAKKQMDEYVYCLAMVNIYFTVSATDMAQVLKQISSSAIVRD